MTAEDEIRSLRTQLDLVEAERNRLARELSLAFPEPHDREARADRYVLLWIERELGIRSAATRERGHTMAEREEILVTVRKLRRLLYWPA